jgi:hypothetical protein
VRLRAIGLLLLLLPSAAPVSSAEVRKGTGIEIEAMLAGCWTQEITPLEKKFERAGFFNEHQMCFHPAGVVEMWSIGGNDMEIEGLGTTGTYKVENERLRFTGELSDGWLFGGAYDLSCDVLMVPDKGMKLHNCHPADSADGRSVPDSTFYRM